MITFNSEEAFDTRADLIHLLFLKNTKISMNRVKSMLRNTISSQTYVNSYENLFQIPQNQSF